MKLRKKIIEKAFDGRKILCRARDRISKDIMKI